MGRKAVYRTEAERLEARRTQNRRHVRAHRCRKKLAEQQDHAANTCSTDTLALRPAEKLAEQQSLASRISSTDAVALRRAKNDATNIYHIISPPSKSDMQLRFSHFFGPREYPEYVFPNESRPRQSYLTQLTVKVSHKLPGICEVASQACT